MLQNPQVASMLTPFHHAAAMQAAALHHAAASQNNASVGGTPPAETSLFNTSLNPSNNIRECTTILLILKIYYDSNMNQKLSFKLIGRLFAKES